MKKHMKKVIALFCAIALLATSFAVDNLVKEPVQVKAADEVVPVTLDGFENVTISDFDGITDGEYTQDSGKNYTSGTLKEGENFDKILFSTYLTMNHSGSEAWNVGLDIGGTGAWTGIGIFVDSSDLLHIEDKYNERTVNGEKVKTAYTITPSQAGVETFTNDEFLLQLAIEYSDATTIKIGVYIEGEWYKNYKFIDCPQQSFGKHVGIVYADSAKSAYVKLTSVEYPSQPVQLEGFGNLTLKDFSMAAGEYSSGVDETFDANGNPKKASISPYNTVAGLTNLDKQLVSMKVKFANVDFRQSILFGGTGLWTKVFNLHLNASGSHLIIDRSWGGALDTGSYETPTMSAETAGVTSFIDNEILLQMSFEYDEIDANNKADLTIGVYINGKLYGNEHFVIPDCNMDNAACGLGVYLEEVNDVATVMTLDNVEFPAEPIQLDGYQNITFEDFDVHNTSTEMYEGIYKVENQGLFKLRERETFDETLLSMNLRLANTDDWGTQIEIAGNGDWEGIMIRVNSAGTELYVLDQKGYTDQTNQATKITNQTAKISSFVEREFLLQLAINFGEVDADNKATLDIDIYIDGTYCTTYSATGCQMDHFGAFMRIALDGYDGDDILWARNVEFDPFYLYEEVTVEDFVDGSGNVMESKAYQCADPVYGTYDMFKLADHTDFEKKLLSMKVKFKEGDATTRIDIAGAVGFSGLMVYPNTSGSHLFVVANTAPNYNFANFQALEIAAANTNVTNFINEEFLLQLTFDFDEADDNNKANLKLGVYINGELYGGEPGVIKDCPMEQFGNYIGLYRQADHSAIIVGSVNEEFPADPGIQPSARYEKLTFGHFGIFDKTYPHISSAFAASGKSAGRDTLNETVTSGNIKMVGDKTFYIVWGGASDWSGLFMFASKDTMQLKWNNGSNTVSSATGDTLSADIAFADGKKFVGDEYHIMLSAELVNNNGGEEAEADDIKIGIWFDGVLYNQQYFYVNDKGSELGNYFSVYCGDNASTETDSVTFGNEMDLLEQPSADLERVSFTEFGLEDGSYNSEDLKVGAYRYGDSVDGIALCGKVKFDKEENPAETWDMGLVIGGNETSVWDRGLRLTMWNWSSGELVLWENGTTYHTFDTAKAGVDYFNEEFELMWSLKLVDHAGDGNVNDLMVGVYFNGFLYENAYVYIDDYGTSIGNALAAYGTGDSKVYLNHSKEYSKIPNEEFDRISLSDFGLETDKYDSNGDIIFHKTADEYADGLDKVVFSGDFRLSDSATYHIIYGGTSDWNGFRFIINSSGSMSVAWFHNFGDGNGDVKQGETGVTLEDIGLSSIVKQTFNLKISTELVDNDGDGNKNDIKLAIWVNDRRYESNATGWENGYLIASNWGNLLGNHFSIYCANTPTSILLRNDATYQENPYYYEEISEYRVNKNDKGRYTDIPEAPEGYIFSGWYEDAEFTTPIEPEETKGQAWAKFVDDETLVARAQVKVNADGTVPSGETDVTSLRLITTVDSLYYRSVGFLVARQDSNGDYVNEKDTNSVSGVNGRTVYEKLYAVGSTSTITYKPTIFSWMSDYFKTFTLNNIPQSDYGVNIKATPYWITMDGTIVKGEAREVCVNDYKTGKNTSNAYSFDFLGEDTMPIAGYFGPYPITNLDDAKLFPDYNTEAYFKLIAEAGINSMVYSQTDYAQYPDLVKKQLEYGEKYGIGIYVYDSELLELTTAEDVASRIANYSNYASFLGIHVVDEPFTEAMTNYIIYDLNNYEWTYGDTKESLEYSMEKQKAKWHTKYTTLVNCLEELGVSAYCNLNPVYMIGSKDYDDYTREKKYSWSDEPVWTKYEEYITTINNDLKPSAVSYDFYPFTEMWATSGSGATATYDVRLYFENMDAIRQEANNTGKAFWTVVQAGSQWNDDSETVSYDTNYYPTKGQFMWNVNTCLAFGAQGIQYFPLIQAEQFAYSSGEGVDTVYDFNVNGLIGGWGNKTQWYYYAQEINKHIAEIDGVLMNSSIKTILANGTAVSAMGNLTSSDFSSNVTYVTDRGYGDVDEIGDTASGDEVNVLIGFFDYCGKTALYVVNYDMVNSQSIDLLLEEEMNIMQIQNAETTKTQGDVISLAMEPGEGVLLVLE